MEKCKVCGYEGGKVNHSCRLILQKRCKDLESQVSALEEMLSECTSHGELDSRLFNSYMEHAIKNR